jgi:23S rRNA (adenine2503-C2)-methyltransferase
METGGIKEAGKADGMVGEARGLSPEEWMDVLGAMGQKSFHGAQVFKGLHQRCLADWASMTDLALELRARLAAGLPIEPLAAAEWRQGADGTRKYAFRLKDGLAIESVLMTHQGDHTKNRRTLCVSSQVGCAMGCGFCATGSMGFLRDLSAAEIVGQVLDVTRLHRRENPAFKINNVVFMGMGEPLLNYEAVLRSVRLLNHRDGQRIGIRRMTISTCGLPEQIRRLAGEDLDVVLAVSLHAPNDALRNRIMPVNRRWPLGRLMEACGDYIQKTRRRVTFEYALMDRFNDEPKHGLELAALLKGSHCNVNLIPVNETRSRSYIPSAAFKVKAFYNILKDNGISVVIREAKGLDICGACGQLIQLIQQESPLL